MSKLTFEVGKSYQTRNMQKATILLIQPTYMVGEIEGRADNPYSWKRNGYQDRPTAPSGYDLLAEWREPVRMTAWLCRHRTLHHYRIFDETLTRDRDEWELRGVGEIVEGEGVE